MSRKAVFFSAVLLAFLPACQEKEVLNAEGVSSLQLHPSLLSDGKIDWNREFEILQNEKLFEEAAIIAGTDAITLNRAIRIQVDLEETTIRVISDGENGEEAQRYTDSFLRAYVDWKQRAELRQGQNEVAKQTAASRIPTGGRTLDKDRLTYEKALEALEEDPSGGIKIPVDGVLFKKTGDEGLRGSDE